MRLLLDTHIALWAITDSPRLSAVAREMILAPENTVTISAATIWEIAIKSGPQRTGSTAMPVSATEALGYCQAAGFALLPITPEHARTVESLPLIHADPFDRILVAQALSEPMRLLTHDTRLPAYSDLAIAV